MTTRTITIAFPTLTLWLAAGVTSAVPSYIARIDVPATDSQFATAADLDGDGFPELLGLSNAQAELIIYYNRGDGTYRYPPERYPTEPSPVHVTIGDMTNDLVTSLPDILVVSRAGTIPSQMLVRGDLTILQNNGSAPGSPGPRFLTACPNIFLDGSGMTNGNQPGFATLADLDLDGRLDIVGTSEFGNSIQVLFQGHSRTGCAAASVCSFGFPDGATCTPTSTGLVNPRSAAVGRFVPNIHMSPDVVSLNLSSGTVAYHLHLNPDRSKLNTLSSQSFQVGGSGSAMMIATPLNSDAVPDLLVANANSNDLSVLRALNASNLSAPIFEGSPTDPMGRRSIEYPANTNPVWVDVGEFELGPGEPGTPTTPFADAVAANRAIDRISVLPGVDDGSFLKPQCYASGDGPSTVTAVELNGDAFTDVVAANPTGNSLSALLGRGSNNGGFDLAYRRSSRGNPVVVASGEVTGDGNIDLVVGHDDTMHLTVLGGRGDGRFGETSASVNLPSAPLAVATASLDGDATAEVISVTSGPGEIRIFQSDTTESLYHVSTLATADGATDLLALALDPSPGAPVDLILANPTSSSLIIVDTAGSLALSAASSRSLAAMIPATYLASGHFAGTGLDVATLAPTGAIQVFLNDGIGNLSGGSPIATGALSANGIAAGDLTRDGNVDLLITHDGGEIVIMVGDGSGGFSALAAVAFPDSVRPLRTTSPLIGYFSGSSDRNAFFLVPWSNLGVVMTWNPAQMNLDSPIAYGTGKAPITAIWGAFDTAAMNLDGIAVLDTSDGPDTWTTTILSGRRWDSYPPADAGPDVYLCAQNPTLITLGSPGKSFLTYAWLPAADVSDPALAQPTTSLAGTYTVTVTNPQTGLSNTDTVVVTSESTPMVDIQPNPAALCSGTSNVTLDAGSGFATVVWSTGDEGRYLNVAPATDTTYTATVTTPGGCTAMGSRLVSVVPGVNLVANVSPLVKCEGSSTPFGADASMSSAPAPSTLAYQWTIVEPTSDWAIATPTTATTSVTVSAPYNPRVVTLRLVVTASPGGCTSTRDFRLEVLAASSTADLGNDLRAIARPTDDVELSWGNVGASLYEVFAVNFKTDIPTIFSGVPVASGPSSPLRFNEPAVTLKFYQTRGSCP